LADPVFHRNIESLLREVAMPDEFYETLPPSPELSPFVRRYFYVEADVDLTIRLAPTGYVSLGAMFNSGEITVTSGGIAKHCPSRLHLVGQIRDRENIVCYRGHIGHLLTEFTPTGFHRLLKIHALRITNQFPEVYEVDPGLHQALWLLLAGCNTREARLKALDCWLLSLIPDALPDDPYVGAASASIERSDGNVRVSDLSAQLGICARHLNRVFNHIVGVPPKYFAQVRQINRLLNCLYEGDTAAALSVLAHDCGYYDQAHLIKAMRRFCGEAPGRVLTSDDPVLNSFLAKSFRTG
jgi:AraC-like DNA-binding protein